ncbi:ATP-binding response regulator [Methylobacterium organophilum]|nr:ATP-binding protein [Methylobacterium organophilum]
MSDAPAPAPLSPIDLNTIWGALQGAHFGLAVFARDGRLIAANGRLKAMFDRVSKTLSPGETLGAFLSALARTHEAVVETKPRDWAADLAAAVWREEAREVPMADGRVLEFLPSRDEVGRLVLSVQDITRLKRGERALQAARDLAETANLTKSRFLRAANHDLRQPLATLKILIYTCLSLSDEAARREALHAMDVSVEVMEDLIRALLHIGQLDAGNIVPRKATFPASALLDRLRIQFEPLAREKGLILDVLPCALPIVTDKALLERVLANLVANAITYTPVGRVTVACVSEGTHCRIEVRDTGPGIAPDEQERIFEEFYRIGRAEDGQRKRLGLGLSIAKRISELAGHPILLESRLGEGSTFSIQVPLGDVWQSEVAETEISEMLAGQFAGLPVLVIEDDADLRRVLTGLLQRWGMEVTACARLAEVEAAIVSGALEPLLVLSDYRLSGHERGTEVCTRLRAHLGADLPCVIVTADADAESHARIRDLGFPVLTKPISPPRLRVLMHRLLYETTDSLSAEPLSNQGGER